MSGWCVAVGLLVLGHPLPDQHVERAVQVQVYPDRIEIHYYIGINDNTVAERLRQAQPKVPVPSDPKAALLEYGKRAFSEIAGQMVVTLDGERQTVKPIEHTRVYKHHVQLECVYHIPIGASDTPRKVALVDKNFHDAPGAHRMAIKGRGGAFVLDATAPPILARVKRIPWTELTKEQKIAATRLEGSLVIPPVSDS